MSAILTWLLVLMTALLCVGIWIGPALIAVGVVLLELFTNRPTTKLIGAWTFNVLTSTDIVSLPLFILMGELLFRTRLSQSLFSGIAPWMSFLPGRLFHTTVIGCSMFAAISGSSAATTQVVGRITLTELLRRGYDKGLAVGSLAGAGTLGFLIPPSIPMIIYAVLAEESLAAPVHGGLPAGLRARRLLHGLHGDPYADQSQAAAGGRPHSLDLDRPPQEPGRARAGRLPDPDRARHHVCRHRQPVGGVRHRRAGRRCRCGLPEEPDLAGRCAMRCWARCRRPA